MKLKRRATKEDWLLKCQLLKDPETMMEDEYGNQAEPWQQAKARLLNDLIDTLDWRPIVLCDGNGKYGVWNQFEECLLLPCIYDEIGELPEPHPYDKRYMEPIPVKKNGKWGLVEPDGTNSNVVPFEYDSIRIYSAGFLLEKNNLYGLYYHPSGLEQCQVMDCIADEIWFNEDWFVELYRRNNKIGIIEPFTDAIFDSIDIEKEEVNARYLVTMNGIKGYLSKSGDFIPTDEISMWEDDQVLRSWYFPN